MVIKLCGDITVHFKIIVRNIGGEGRFWTPSVLRVKKNKNKSLFNWVVIECVFYSERCMCVNDSVIPKFYKMHPSSTEKKMIKTSLRGVGRTGGRTYKKYVRPTPL